MEFGFYLDFGVWNLEFCLCLPRPAPLDSPFPRCDRLLLVRSKQDIFALSAKTPVAEDLLGRVERGESLSVRSTDPAAQPFIVAALRHAFPQRPIAVITAGVKPQEIFH